MLDLCLMYNWLKQIYITQWCGLVVFTLRFEGQVQVESNRWNEETVTVVAIV